MSQLTIPDTLVVLLPLLASALSSWLNDDGFQPGANAFIALSAIIVAAVACELLASNFTFSNPAWFFGILGYTALLMKGDLSVLYAYLLKKSSPVSGSKPPQATRPAPTPLILPKQ